MGLGVLLQPSPYVEFSVAIHALSLKWFADLLFKRCDLAEGEVSQRTNGHPQGTGQGSLVE